VWKISPSEGFGAKDLPFYLPIAAQLLIDPASP
jgi:hypothetical protein